MEVKITGTNIEATEAIQSYVQEKIGGLTRFSDDILGADVELAKVSNKDKNRYQVKVNFKLPKDLLHVDQSDDDLYAAIDDAQKEMEGQLKKRKGKFESKKREAQKNIRELKDYNGITG